MTHPNSNKSGGARAGLPAGQRSRAKWFALLLAIAAVALTALWLGSGNRQPEPTADGAAAEPPPASKASPSNPPVSATEAAPELQKLKGQWLRPDGGYVMVEIEIVADLAMDGFIRQLALPGNEPGSGKTVA